MRPLTILASLTLAACQTAQPGVRVQQVRVPVPAVCLPADQIPPEPPLVADTLIGDWNHDGPVIAASAVTLRSWGREMHAVLEACAG